MNIFLRIMCSCFIVECTNRHNRIFQGKINTTNRSILTIVLGYNYKSNRMDVYYIQLCLCVVNNNNNSVTII